MDARRKASMLMYCLTVVELSMFLILFIDFLGDMTYYACIFNATFYSVAFIKCWYTQECETEFDKLNDHCWFWFRSGLERDIIRRNLDKLPIYRHIPNDEFRRAFINGDIDVFARHINNGYAIDSTFSHCHDLFWEDVYLVCPRVRDSELFKNIRADYERYWSKIAKKAAMYADTLQRRFPKDISIRIATLAFGSAIGFHYESFESKVKRVSQHICNK